MTLPHGIFSGPVALADALHGVPRFKRFGTEFVSCRSTEYICHRI
jgi:hypothetical protein